MESRTATNLLSGVDGAELAEERPIGLPQRGSARP